ncbi:MAG TPA: hypothetical protein VIK95_07035 [Egibacteraceae bacterium]
MRQRESEHMRQQIGYLYETGRWITPPLRDYPTGTVPQRPRRRRRRLRQLLFRAGARSS